VALVTEQGHSVPKVAEALGVSIKMFYRWKENSEKKADIILSEDERTELKDLLKEDY
jgi:transposase